MLDGENVSWQVFLVQLKGHERFTLTTKNGRAYVTHSLSTDRLRDYFEVYREPVNGKEQGVRRCETQVRRERRMAR
jgi:hypothetical protein